MCSTMGLTALRLVNGLPTLDSRMSRFSTPTQS
jgi:hypothetical protein